MLPSQSTIVPVTLSLNPTAPTHQEPAAHSSPQRPSLGLNLVRTLPVLFPYDDRPCDPSTGSPRGRSVGLPEPQLAGKVGVDNTQISQEIQLTTFFMSGDDSGYALAEPDLRAHRLSWSSISSETDETLYLASDESFSSEPSSPAPYSPKTATGRTLSALSKKRKSLQKSLKTIDSTKFLPPKSYHQYWLSERTSISGLLPVEANESHLTNVRNTFHGIGETFNASFADFAAVEDDLGRNVFADEVASDTAPDTPPVWLPHGAFLESYEGQNNFHTSCFPSPYAEGSLLSALDRYHAFLESTSTVYNTPNS